jgi:hypothetical protein
MNIYYLCIESLIATVGQMVELGVSDSSRRRNEIYHVHPSQDRCQRVKIAVVGATGATGSRVVKHALARGHFITAVARHPERLSSADRLSAIRGDVLSPGSLTGSFDGVDVAISCIGPEKNLSPGTLMSVGVANILTDQTCKRPTIRPTKWYRLERWTRALLAQPPRRPCSELDSQGCNY